jgi:hypothetical protein
MQYGSSKVSKITLHADSAVGISTTGRGANLDTVGFNLTFIAQRDPKLATEVVRLWQQANTLREVDPRAVEEDFVLAETELKRLFATFVA